MVLRLRFITISIIYIFNKLYFYDHTIDDELNNDTETQDYPEDQEDLEIENHLEFMEQEFLLGTNICTPNELPFLDYSQKPKSLVTQIRCSARTLELCIEDTLKEKPICNLILKAREVI